MDTEMTSLLFPSRQKETLLEDSDTTLIYNNTTLQAPVTDPLKFLQARLWVRRILLPFLILPGLFGNAMIVVIVTRLRASRSTMNMYFLCLALSDLCVIFTGPVEIWLQSAFGVSVRNQNTVLCKLSGFLFNAATAVSAWIVLALVVQRALCVVWPHRVGVMCTARKTGIAIGIIVIVVSSACSHLLYGLVKRNNSCAFKDDYLPFLLDVWARMEIFLYSAVPLCGLCFSNFVLVVKLRASVKMAGEEFAASDKQQVERRRKVNSTSLTALLVSVAFMLFTLPIAVWNGLKYAPIGKTEKTVEQMSFDYFLQAVLYCLMYFNFSINFYIYFLTGRKFRDEFKKVMGEVLCCTTSPSSQSSD